ncbi:FAD/NAD-binding domain-containing protein [Schizopora paradoxa]|uniref:FAD/NAD-binding domain-containing protein n=1 Tax=Schizopora paradoxa TaxID=27342 RepID=A0A0H2SH88_9AGAM|nr:FAD/NAD-binding domain-containing protein [Schizopora paradoxa]
MASGIHHLIGTVEPTPAVTTNGNDGHEERQETNGGSIETTPLSTSNLAQAHLNGHGAANGEIETKSTDAGPSSFKLGDFSIDEYRPMKVVVIGAGFSGIIAGIRFPQKVPNVELTIYDKNAGIGGTWFTNKYPGLACDVPSHCYQLTFEENPHWSSFYAPGPEILAYLQRVVDKYKIMRYIKLRHELVHAQYDEAKAKWRLRIRRPILPSASSGRSENAGGEIEYEEFEDTADFVLSGAGGLSRWKWPEIEGLESFKGTLVHSAAWDVGEDGETWQESVKDWGEKRVGVIGVGSSALQVVPSLQPHVASLKNYVRGKTWLATPFVSEKLAKLMARAPESDDYKFTEEDLKLFDDPEFYKTFRHELEDELNSVHVATLTGSAMQNGAREAFRALMLKKLAKKPWIADHLMPDFPVACRRLTPGPGYLEALCEDNVEFVPTHIKRITETGIELVDGTHHDLDVIVCATGYDSSFNFPFPIIGRNGLDLKQRFTPHPETYLGLCTNGFPNLFFCLGPNSAVGSGSLLVILERQVAYAVQVVKKMQRERLKSVEVGDEALNDFEEYLQNYFPKTVYSQKCRSWYKVGKEEGRVVGLWPGSCLHAIRTLENPRWEDFKYESFDGDRKKNRFYWLGDGSTLNEIRMSGDRAWYLNEDQIDRPPVPE